LNKQTYKPANPSRSHEITRTLDHDDPVTYNIRIWNATKDTTILGINNTAYILPAGILKNGSNYNAKVTSTDGSLSTESNIKTFNTTVGIDTPTIDDKVLLYPNPVTDFLNIRYGTNISGTVHREIYNLQGKLIENDRTEVHGETEEKINVTKLARGMYIIKLINGEKSVRIKFIKK